MPKLERPISPFLSAYAWRYTFFNPSVIHRTTGVALAFGLVALTYVFWSIAAGAQSYSRAQSVFAHPVFKCFIAIWAWSLFFHLLNGVRHLSWDAGYGFEKTFARRTGRFVLVASTVLTLAFCLYVFVPPDTACNFKPFGMLSVGA